MKLALILLLISSSSLAQSKLNEKLTRKITISNPLLMNELKNAISALDKDVYLCHVSKDKDKSYFKLTEIGYVSELKDEHSSFYTIVNKSIIFIQTGIEDIVDSNEFFRKVILPLTKGLIINDLLPDGSLNPDTLPYAGYDPIDITIMLEKNKVSIIKEAQQ